MRRVALVHLICCCVARACRAGVPARRPPTPTASRRRPQPPAGRRRRPQPQPRPRPPPRPRRPRSLFELTPRQFEIGGRFSSVDGDPARFQRYQDIRDGVLFTDARYACEDAGRATGSFQRRGRQRRLARSAVRRRLRAYRPLRDLRPAGTRSRSSTASTPRRRTRTSGGALVLDDATQRSDPERRRRRCRPTCRSPRSSICTSGATSAA